MSEVVGEAAGRTGGPPRRDATADAVAPRAEDPAQILEAPGWRAVLEQFARVTGLATSLFDADARLRVGPLTPTPLSERLAAAGCWDEGGLCLAADAEAARACVAEGAAVHRTECGMLALFAVPLSFAGRPVGAVVAGWAFDTFPDPVATDRLARLVNIPFAELWQIARQQPPVSREKLNICAGLLQTLADSFVQERVEILNEQARSEELLALNRLAQALSAAASVGEIGAAVVEAALALARAEGAALQVSDGDGGWLTAAARGLGDDTGRTPDGRERRAVTSRLRIPVEGADGRLLGMIEISGGRDADEPGREMRLSALAAQTAVALHKRQLFTDLERERARLEQANRTKDEFLSVLSHELRTPLTPILGWVSMLDREELRGNPETLSAALEAIKRNARQELHLVDELLDLSRILNEKVMLEPELINPADAIAGAFAFAQTLAAPPRRLRLRLDAGQNLPPVSADPKRLQQILSNLAANAVKFTADGGTITLGARRAEPQAVEFFVADTGVGISPESLPHIFDRFRQADSTTTRRFGGLGVGLSVVRGLAELHGGRVWAESEGEGRGATFVVRLPAADVPERRAEARAEALQADEPKPARRGPRRRGRVLVVDDAPDTLAVLRAMIEAAGHEVETADSVESALEAARRLRPDVVVTDIGMPDSDGFDLLRRLRAEAAPAALPVVALTGFASPQDRDAALGAGFAAHIPKPVEPASLAAALEELLAKER
jgi:signal transduction histidine kinase/ActR/RegA family two-component response regulator